MNRTGIILLLLATLAWPVDAALGAIVVSAQSGDWNDPSTWTPAGVPTVGDEVSIAAGNLVAVSDSVVTPVESVTVLAGAHLSILPSGQLWRAAAGRANGWLEVRGEFSLLGTLASTDAAAAPASDLLLRTTRGSSVSLQGTTWGEANVVDVAAHDDARVRLEVDSVPAEATHVQLRSGWYPGAIYRIDARPGPASIVLSGGLAAPPTVVAEAGGDSVVVVSPGTDLWDWTGAVLLDASGTGRMVDAALPRAAGDSVVCFLETDPALWNLPAGEAILATEGIVPGARVQFFRAARILGAATAPNAVEDGSGLSFQGSVDADWFEIAHTSHPSNAINVSTGSAPLDFDRGWLHDYHAKYQIGLLSTLDSGDPPSYLEWEELYVENARGVDDGDYGHAFAFDDFDFVDTWVLRSCVARRTLDDFVFARRGAKLVVDGCRLVHCRSGNVVDAKATNLGMEIEVSRCRVYGYGENAIQADEGKAYWTTHDNLFSRCGASFNMNEVDNHNTTQGAANAILAISGMSFHSERDTLQWAAAHGAHVGVIGGEGVVFRDGLLRFNGSTQVASGVPPFPADSQNFSAVYSTPDSPGRFLFERCRFADNPRRGVDPTPYGHTSRGIYARGGYWKLIDCEFGGELTDEESSTNQDPFVDAGFGTASLRITSCRFLGGHDGVVGPNVGIAPTIDAIASSFVGQEGHAIRAGSPAEIEFCSFASPGDEPSLQIDAGGWRVVGNVFVSDAPDAVFLAFDSASETLGLVSEWNVLATGSPSFVEVDDDPVGPSAWAVSHDLHSWWSVDDPAAWSLVVDDLDDLELFEGAIPVDFVTDPAYPLDPDGSARDAGAHPLWEWPVTAAAPGAAATPPGTVRLYPNPFRAGVRFGADRGIEGPLRLDVYDLRGRRVVTRRFARLEPGTLLWEGEDERGRRVSNGPYLLRLRTGEGPRTARIVYRGSGG